MASPTDGTAPSLPDAAGPAKPPLTSVSSSSSASGSESDMESRPRTTRLERPRLANRVPSGSILVHKSHPIELSGEEFPPDDARAMSPRRNSEDLQRLGEEARQTLKDHAKKLQSSLQALAERIDEVKSDHDRLESENKFLQDYIGGLTRTMSKGDLGPSGKGKK